FLTSGGLGTMGYSLPAGLGAAIAKPRRQVVSVCGDGAFQMSMCELGTVCQSHAALKIIVFDNARLGMVRELQDKLYGGRHCGTYLGGGNPDFVALCRAYGIPAQLAASNAEAERFAAEMLAARGPFVLVCRTDPDTPTV
ncbi:MAG: thiamine pyrophosphate-dependent enzyme, partial [Acutalibacteraceae bacterium]